MKKLAIFSLIMTFVVAVSCSKDDFDPLAGWTGGTSGEDGGTAIPKPTEPEMKVVAHRGGSTEAGTSKYPDNSRASLRYAIGIGCYASECDIYITADDEVLVAHAESGCEINNLTTWDHTLAEIRAKGNLANGEELPVLEDFIDIVMEAGTTKLWLDVKNITVAGSSTDVGRDASARACERACEIIKEKNAMNFCEFIVTSNSSTISATNSTIYQRCLSAANSVGCAVGLMGYSSASTYISRGYTWVNIETTHFYYEGVDQSPKYTIEDYLNSGLELSVYNADTDDDMAYYLQYKDRLKAICTNYPSKLLTKWAE